MGRRKWTTGCAAAAALTRKFHCSHSIPWARRYTTTEAIFSSIHRARRRDPSPLIPFGPFFPFLSVGRRYDSSAVPAAPPPAAAAMGSSGCWGPGTLPAWRARLWALRLSDPPRRLPACHSQGGGIRGGLDGSWMVDDGFAVRTSLALASNVHCTAGPQTAANRAFPAAFSSDSGAATLRYRVLQLPPPAGFFSSFPEELTELWILRV
jgi:hypothetical protein